MIAAQGNDMVIAALEQFLVEARKGRAGYLVALMLADGERPMGGWFGIPTLESSAITHLEHMAAQWDASVINRTLPDRAPGVPANRCVYNVPLWALCYDFIAWLINAEMTRRREGAPAPLRVGFWFGRDGRTGLEMPYRGLMFEHVVRPALALVGAVEDETAVDGRVLDAFTSRPIAEAARAGETVPKLRSTDHARKLVRRHKFGNPVTITLREATHYQERNSDLRAWLAFASNLENHGHRVVFVRDTEHADEPLDGFLICPAASRDLLVRQALYESARMNFFVSNGPLALAEFSDYPWTAFMPIEPDGHGYAPATPKFWREHFGVEAGSQFPWSRSDQRIVWETDDYNNLVRAWSQIAQELKVA
jgi:hypothetical protein